MDEKEKAKLVDGCVNTLRFLAVDAIQKANSGHPGTPMGAATLAYVIFDRFLKHNPANPDWADRDRFVLSPGHASMMLYAALHLTGYDLPISELQKFRQLGSRTPGHPEYGVTPGVEMTTGPLGQGIAHAVGMAVVERWLAAHYNRPGKRIIDHFTYAIVSDGAMQEGITSEAASLAGTLGLGKLIAIYDDNHIQIEGSIDITFRENVARRFRAYGWQVVGPVNGHDADAVEAAIGEARSCQERPSLVICETVIGYGSRQGGTARVHGSPLGEEEVRWAKENLGWPTEPDFHVPEDVREHMGQALERGRQWEEDWNSQMEAYRDEYPEDAAQLEALLRGELSPGWDIGLEELFPPGTEPMATRIASGKVLASLAPKVHALIGGSADLSPSTKTTIEGAGDFGWQAFIGHNLHFGVREHAMGAIAGGMALHGGVVPYTATFLAFSDYMRPPMRLAALMGIQVIYVFTHDSIGVGDDGPTHQPIEHLMNLRTIPNMTVIRPADATESAEAWRLALENTDGPTALIFTRQKVPVIDRTVCSPSAGARQGAYTLWQSGEGDPQLILIGTGSEVQLAINAGQTLAGEGVNVRVVSMPSWEHFDRQDQAYRDQVLPPAVRARVSVEAGSRIGWERYVGLDGASVGMSGFGTSAPAGELFEHFGITAKAVADQGRALLRDK